ncbi:LolA family protein [Sunxiuqinia sp. A32]|uniref:LolA family protein n=1 Tax=Sunxiuqinia sp. A32 TaxID=3461496 RepID=UPI004045BF98
MKRIFFLVLIVFCWSIVSAQEDMKAKSILEKVSETTQSYRSIKASFNYIMDNKEEGIHDENKGDILLKGNKYQLKLPVLGLEIYSNGQTVWTYMKDANEVSIAEFDEEMNEMMDPSKLFTIYQQGFNYKFIEETTANGKAVYVIDLFPDDEEVEYSKMRIQIEKDRMLINKATMVGREGSNYIVQVSSLTTDIPADDSEFVFSTEKYPDIEIIDLR